MKKMRKRKNFTRRGIKKEIQKKDQTNKANIQYFECNKKGHYKSKCPQLKELEKDDKSNNQKKKRKALKTIWDESSSEKS